MIISRVFLFLPLFSPEFYFYFSNLWDPCSPHLQENFSYVEVRTVCTIWIAPVIETRWILLWILTRIVIFLKIRNSFWKFIYTRSLLSCFVIVLNRDEHCKITNKFQSNCKKFPTQPKKNTRTWTRNASSITTLCFPQK